LIPPIAISFGIDPVQMGVIFLANSSSEPDASHRHEPLSLRLPFQAAMNCCLPRQRCPFILILLAAVGYSSRYVPELTSWPVAVAGPVTADGETGGYIR